MSYRNEPKKHSSGAKERLLLFFVAIATVAFFSISKPAQASTNADDLNVVDMPANPADFGAWFHSQDLPIVKNGHSFWDYIVYSAPDEGYNVQLLNANGFWITGDTSYSFFTTDTTFSCGGTFCFGYNFYVNPTSTFNQNYNGGKNYYDSTPYNNAYFTSINTGSWFDSAGSFSFSPTWALYSSQDFYYLNVCTNIGGEGAGTIYNSEGVDPSAFWKCGSWDSSCSPVMSTYTGCGTVDPPPVDPPTTLTCTAVFDSIPGWTDPLGMFTGFFQALFSWFGCAFNGVLTGLHDSVVTASMIVGDFFSSATDTIGTYFSNITGNISGMFSGLTTSIAEKASFVSDVITGIPDATGVVFSTLFIPTSEYLSTQTDIIKTSFSEKFPALASMQASVSSGVSSLSGASTTFTSPTLSLYGSSNIPVVNTSVMNEYMPQIRTWVTMFLWFFCAIFCLRAIRNLIHPKTA